MSNTRVTLASRAQRDLRGILRYTRDTWGESRWVKTKERFERAFEQLSNFPRSGVDRNHNGIRVRMLFLSPFAIIYRVDSLGVTILRIAAQGKLGVDSERHEEWQGEDV